MELTASGISDLLARDAERVCRDLLPNGRRQGHEWCAGSVGGEAGDSLKVRLDGDKAGRWSDFANPDDHGDLLDLWAAVRRCDVGEAIREAKSWLGVSEPELRPQRERTYSPPQVPKCEPVEGEVMAWLIGRGLTIETLRAFRVASSGKRALFPFLSPGGERVMVKWRSITSKDTAPTSKDQRPSLFGWQAIHSKARTVAITEGEIDAMSLYQIGIPALSVPFGGGAGAKQQWVECEYDNLARFDVIYLALDADEPGRQAAAEIAKRLGPERCRLVELPRKDANDCLRECSEDEIRDAFKRGKPIDPDGLVSAGALKDDVLSLMFPDPDAPKSSLDLPWERFANRLEFRYGELVIVWGINGHGKTGWVNQCGLHAIRQGERVLVASLEYRPERFLRKLARQACGLNEGEPSRDFASAVIDWMGDRLWLWGKTGSQRVEALIEVMTYAVRRYGIRVFIVDSLLKLGLAEDDYNAQKLAVEALVDFKNEHNVIVLLVCHARKQEREDSNTDKMDIRGAGAIGDLADTIIGVRRNKIKEREAAKAEAGQPHSHEVLDLPDTWIDCGKQRNGQWEGRSALYYAHNCEQFIEYDSQRPWQYVRWSETAKEAAA